MKCIAEFSTYVNILLYTSESFCYITVNGDLDFRGPYLNSRRAWRFLTLKILFTDKFVEYFMLFCTYIVKK